METHITNLRLLPVSCIVLKGKAQKLAELSMLPVARSVSGTLEKRDSVHRGASPRPSLPFFSGTARAQL